MSQIPPTTQPTNPYHIARAYGLQEARPAAAAGGSSRPPAVAPLERAPSQEAPGISRLLAGRVPGGVDFSGGEPTVRKEDSVIPFYRHPADRNAAATNIKIGRTLDVSG